jgi:RHS repeat-associated protein
VWQGYQVLAEHYGSTGTVLVDYIFAAGRMIAKVSGSAANYYLNDRLSVRLTIDSYGSVSGRQSHLPFGEQFAESGTQEKHHFTSYERDTETGADYALSRMLVSSVGRFSQADPYKTSEYLVQPQSWNRYAYSQNDSVNFADPQALDREPVFPPFPDLRPPIDDPNPTGPEDAKTKKGNGRGGGGNAGRTKAKFDLQTLKDCLKQLFNVELRSFSTSGESAQIYGTDRISNGGNDALYTIFFDFDYDATSWPSGVATRPANGFTERTEIGNHILRLLQTTLLLSQGQMR